MTHQTTLRVDNYDLAATLGSGQAFRWEPQPQGAWEGVVAGRWVRLQPVEDGIAATCATPQTDWAWLEDYLQTSVDLPAILATFPTDEPMQEAVRTCAGLRLLKQDPWECLASFILSSTKQIVQIQQIVRSVCQCFGEPVAAPRGHEPVNAFPGAQRIAQASEAELRACKMGFRAAYLKGAAEMVAGGEVNLEALRQCSLDEARAELLRLPGVGRKIADCVLLFAYGFPKAFPIDVWVIKALRQLYFKNRKIALPRLQRFTGKHFGPNAGYAQQYLFHYMRVVRPKQRSG